MIKIIDYCKRRFRTILVIAAVSVICAYAVPSVLFAQTGADIVVSSIEFNPPYPQAGEPLEITTLVTNIGSENGAAGRIYLYVDPMDDPTTTPISFTHQTYSTLSTAPGGEAGFTLVNYVFEEDGCYQIWVQVDVDDELAEINEDNNWTGPITLSVGEGCVIVDNDDCGNPYELIVGADPQLHDLHQSNDADYFRVFLEAGKTYYAVAERDPGTAGDDVNLNLTMVPEDECESGSFGAASELRFTVFETAYYMLRTKHISDRYGPNTNYTISIEESDESEPNNDCPDATVLIPDDPAQQHLLPNDDTDWFRFIVRSGHKYTVTVVPDIDSNLIIQSELLLGCVDWNNSFGVGMAQKFTAHSNGEHVVRILNQNMEPETDNVAYEVQVTTDIGEIDPITDTDGDAIPDYFEINGWDFDQDGIVDVDLPAMGAIVGVPDIFVEIDYMERSQFSYQPDPESIRIVVESFEEQGIHLHVDYGPESPLTWGTAPIWGQLSGSNSLPYNPYMGQCINRSFMWNKFAHTKSQKFAPEREAIFHYAQWGHKLCREKIIAGVSRNSQQSIDAFQNGASDLIIAMGVWLDADQNPPVDSMAGLFMHELGHNLGLMHGGDNHENLKPNHLSIMNYAYAERGLYTNESGSPSWGTYTYSKYKAINLDESSLDESVGLKIDVGMDGEHNLAGLIHVCPNNDLVLSESVDAVDWDCNGDTAGADLELNLNNSSGSQIITSYQEWGNLVFDGGTIGTFVPDDEGAFSVGYLPLASPTDFDLSDVRELLGLPPLTPVHPPPPVEQTLSVGTAVNNISFPFCEQFSNVQYQMTDLPPGLSYSTFTGIINGIPIQAGTFTTTITVIDSGSTVSDTIRFDVLGTTTTPTTTVQGTITELGTPKEGITVTLVDVVDPDIYQETVTDEDGNYIFHISIPPSGTPPYEIVYEIPPINGVAADIVGVESIRETQPNGTVIAVNSVESALVQETIFDIEYSSNSSSSAGTTTVTLSNHVIYDANLTGWIAVGLLALGGLSTLIHRAIIDKKRSD